LHEAEFSLQCKTLTQRSQEARFSLISSVFSVIMGSANRRYINYSKYVC